MPAIRRPGGFGVVRVAVRNLPDLTGFAVDDENVGTAIVDEASSVFLIHGAFDDPRRRRGVFVLFGDDRNGTGIRNEAAVGGPDRDAGAQFGVGQAARPTSGRRHEVDLRLSLAT